MGILLLGAPPLGHKAQVNLAAWDKNDYGQDFPFIDVARQISNIWLYFGTITAPDVYAYISANGFPTAMPTGSVPANGDNWRGDTNGYLTPRCTFTGSINSSGVMTVSGSVTGDPIFIGQTLKGGTIAVDTVITSGSGTTWQTNVNTAVASATLTAFDPWVLTWTGTADMSLNGDPDSFGGTVINANRFQYDITWTSHGTNTPFGVQVHIANITVAITAVSLFRKSQEALKTGGQITSPHFISFYQKWGRMRYMDILRSNGNPLAQFSQRPLMTDCSWVGSRINTTFYGGLCTNSGNDYTAPTSVHGGNTTWAQGDMLQCRITNAPVVKTVSGFTNANPAKITATAHGYSTGDQVVFPHAANAAPFNPGQLENNLNGLFPSGNGFALSPVDTITVIDANNFTLNGVDSTTWPTYISGGIVMKPARFKSGSLPFKRIVYSNFQNLYDSDLAGLNTAITGNVTNTLSLTYDSTTDVLIFTGGPNNNGAGLCGSPYEVVLQVANECNVSPWLCLPYRCDDAYATSLATLVKSNLNSNLVCCFEFSNEVWNLGGGFDQSPYATVQGALLFPSTVSIFQSLNEWYGFRFYGTMSAISTVFAGQMNRVRRIFGVSAGDGNATSATKRLTAPETTVPATPASVADELTFATYLEIDRQYYPLAQSIYNYKAGVATSNAGLIASAFADLDAELNSAYTAFVGKIDNGSGGAGSLLTVSSVSVGSIYVGMIVSGGGIGYLNSPIVTSFGTGTGGAGTYNLSGPTYLIGAGANFTSTPWSNLAVFHNVIIPFWKGVATTYSLALSQYEGGWGIYPAFVNQPTTYSGGSTYNPLSTTDQFNLLVAYQASSNWAAILGSLLADWKEQGGTYASQFTITGPPPIQSIGMFGMVYPTIFGAQPPAYTTFVNYNNS